MESFYSLKLIWHFPGRANKDGSDSKWEKSIFIHIPKPSQSVYRFHDTYPCALATAVISVVGQQFVEKIMLHHLSPGLPTNKNKVHKPNVQLKLQTSGYRNQSALNLMGTSSSVCKYAALVFYEESNHASLMMCTCYPSRIPTCQRRAQDDTEPPWAKLCKVLGFTQLSYCCWWTRFACSPCHTLSFRKDSKPSIST